MPLLTSFALEDTFFHRLDPRTKLVWLATVLVLCFVTNQTLILAGIAVIVLALSRAAKLDLRSFLPISKMVIYLGILLVLVQSIFQSSGQALFQLGPVNFYSGGFALGVHTTLRLYCMILLFLQFLMWTHPSDLSLALVKAKVPYRYAMLLGLALRFLPVMEEELRGILEAQQARGLDLSNPIRKTLAMAPIATPFCLRALRRANEVALAMELRGYGYRPERTFLRAIGYGRADYAISAGILAGFIAYSAIHAWSLAPI